MTPEEELWRKQAGAARAQTIKRVAIWGTVFALVAGAILFFRWRSQKAKEKWEADFDAEMNAPVPQAKIDEAHKILDDAKKRAKDGGAARRKAMGAARTGLARHSDLGACPLDTASLSATDAMKLTSFVPKGSSTESESPLEKDVNLEADMIDYSLKSKSAHGASGGDDIVRRAKEVAARKPPPFDFTLFIDVEEEPHMVSDKEFMAGHLTGTMYAYDWAADRVVCAASVDTQGSSEVTIVTKHPWADPDNPDTRINGDLLRSGIVQGVQGMLRAGPGVAAAGSATAPSASASAGKSVRPHPKK